MAPIATADLETTTLGTEDCVVLPSPDADDRLRSLWYEHGHPWSETYANPTLTSLPSLLAYNAKARPDKVGFLCPDGSSFRQLTWKEFDAIVHSLAASYSTVFRQQLIDGINLSCQPTVALLGVGHSAAYFATQLALLKLGLRVLLLSPGNADVARDHLLATCNAVGLVVEEQLLHTTRGLGLPTVALIDVPLSASKQDDAEILSFHSPDTWNSHSFIIHSSGTTGLPKPIIHTHRSLMMIARMYRVFPDFAIDNWYLAFPLYHIGGISIALSGLPNGLALTFPPLNWPPAPGAVLRAWTELEAINKPADCLHCAPAIIEDLFEYITHTPAQDFSPLLKLNVLQPGGAALSQVLLEKLVALGCNVKTTYGSTEIGPPWRTMPHTRDNPHCYRVRNLFPESQYLEMQSLGDGVFEPVVYKGFPLAAELWPLPDSPNPYRTNDLFIEDPPNSGLFVLQGRKDDLLVHTNGEKTNALPLQMALDSCPDIQKAAVFGHSRPCTSAVIQPTASTGTRTVNKASILASVERCCRAFATHSRLDPYMVHILRPDQIMPVTPKGSVRRKEAERLYKAELDNMYKKLEHGAEPDAADKNLAQLSDDAYTRYCAQQALGLADISPDASFYSLGLDSQQAVKMRSALMKRFGKFPLMFIFEYCSVAMLTQSLTSLGSRNVSDRATAQHHRWIQDAIARYTAEIQSWPATPPPPERRSGGEIVYLTGATGSLGNAMLEAFVSNPSIEMVYCAIRGGAERLAESLSQRGYATSVCENEKLRVVPYDMSVPELGLSKREYNELAAQVTTVLHNAWKLDFNQPVNEFDRDCLQGTMHLMRFANTCKQKKFAFSSSVATHLGSSAAGKQVAEAEMANDPSLALDTGYAQSKFVVEMLCQTLKRDLGMRVTVFRIGQLCGHSVSGAWNGTEMFPLMITSGAQMKAMPALDQDVDWLPVDVCARSISLLLASETVVSGNTPDAECSVHNLVNPAVISWKEFLDVLDQASGTTFERVPMPEWVARLQSLSEQKSDVPGVGLLGFFEDMAHGDGSAGPSFSTALTQRIIPELASAVPVDVPLMRSYLDRWKR